MAPSQKGRSVRTRPSRSLSLFTIGTFGVFSLVPLRAGGAPAPPASRLKIAHAPLGCITTQVPPVVEAAVAPAPDLAIGKVSFRAAQAGSRVTNRTGAAWVPC